MYENELLKEYISNSELRIYSKNIRVRLSKELASNYGNGLYNAYLEKIDKYYEEIKTLGIKYPNGKEPIIYIYIVPDNNYAKLLDVPEIFDDGMGCGKPVKCYDNDGFSYAYGRNNDLTIILSDIEPDISYIENNIHELSHLVHGEFFQNSSLFGEGFAEALPLYLLDYEDIFDEHREMISSLLPEQVLTASELINQEMNETFGAESVIPDSSCSFRYSYISSYLLVRGIIETIEKNTGYSKIESLQIFLDFMREKNELYDEEILSDLAKQFNMDFDTLLNKKDIQLSVIEKIKNKGMQK